ncbi:MAG: hypothetical protein Q8S21_06880 [Candidatus Paracaedibacteraceae bacterium]|nr:hypothetical protein [Candidatus Paracaedibacteraceae bacterium]
MYKIFIFAIAYIVFVQTPAHAAVEDVLLNDSVQNSVNTQNLQAVNEDAPTLSHTGKMENSAINSLVKHSEENDNGSLKPGSEQDPNKIKMNIEFSLPVTTENQVAFEAIKSKERQNKKICMTVFNISSLAITSYFLLYFSDMFFKTQISLVEIVAKAAEADIRAKEGLLTKIFRKIFPD